MKFSGPLRELHVAEGCPHCGRGRGGMRYFGKSDEHRWRLPADCRDRKRCRGEIATTLIDEAIKGGAVVEPVRGLTEIAEQLGPA